MVIVETDVPAMLSILDVELAPELTLELLLTGGRDVVISNVLKIGLLVTVVAVANGEMVGEALKISHN